MTTVALFGDSTYETSYLRASSNAALSLHHAKAPDYDARLHVLLAEQLRQRGVTATCTNYSVSGMDSSEALSTVFASPTKWSLLLASAPNVVIIHFAINDQLAAMPVATFRANIQTMIDGAVAAGIVPVIATPNFVDYPTHFTYDLNTLLDPYAAALIAAASDNALTLIDVRREMYSSIAHGAWDILGHNDATYLGAWENGSTPGTAAFYTNAHEWIDGAALMAGVMARTLIRHEPLLGGIAGFPDRSAGTALSELAIRSIPILKAV